MASRTTPRVGEEIRPPDAVTLAGIGEDLRRGNVDVALGRSVGLPGHHRAKFVERHGVVFIVISVPDL